MSDESTSQRIEAILAALVTRRMEESLGRIEEALMGWRSGERDAMAPHVEALRHVARIGTLSTRVARSQDEGRDQLLRDAFDLGLLDRDEFVALAGRPPEEVEPPPPLDEEAAESLGASLPEKRTVVDAMLGDGPVILHLDARVDGVHVPDALRDDPGLVLRVGFGLTPPIPDLEVGDDGLRATLTFGGNPCPCVIPWTAIFAVTNEAGQGLIYEEAVPPEVAARMRQAADEAPTAPSDADGSHQEPDPPPPKRPGGHLKLVK